MATIGLSMIVKNESAIITRCLASVLPLVDYILVVDTGSTDGTQNIIRTFLDDHKIDGLVVDEPWRNFGYNRTFGLERLRERADVDYALIMDADDILVLDQGFDARQFKGGMTADMYDLKISHGDISFYRVHIVSNHLPFSVKGALHEYVESPKLDVVRETASGFHIATGGGGVRSQNPRKYHDDAKMLQKELETETDPFLISRYTFYLAQSCRDSGQHRMALEKYLERSKMGYWIEEIYVSLFEAGNMMAALDYPSEEILAHYERATQTIPARAEALHAASRHCRIKGRFAEGLEYAKRGLLLSEPAGLFVTPWVYDYALLDELAVNAYWTGAYRECLDSCFKLLESSKLPASMVQRVATNARLAAHKLLDEI